MGLPTVFFSPPPCAKYLVASAPQWGFWSPWDLAQRPGVSGVSGKTLEPKKAAFAKEIMGKPWYFTTEQLDLAWKILRYLEIYMKDHERKLDLYRSLRRKRWHLLRRNWLTPEQMGLHHETLGDLASKEREATGLKFSVVVAESLYWFQQKGRTHI